MSENEDDTSIEKDRGSLISLYNIFQSHRNYEADKLRESARFFEIVVSALILASFALKLEGAVILAQGTVLLLFFFAGLFSIVALSEIKRCYKRFLRYVEASYNIEELLGLHKKGKKILPEELWNEEARKKIKDLKEILEKKIFIFDILEHSTLVRTYVLVFLIFLVVSIICSILNVLILTGVF